MEVGEGLICIIQSVFPSILGGGGGGAHLHHKQGVSDGGVREPHFHQPQCAFVYLSIRWGTGSFTSVAVRLPRMVGGAQPHHLSIVCLPLPWVEVGEGLICIIQSVFPSTLGGGGGGAHLHHKQGISDGGVREPHLHQPHNVPLST